MRGKITGLLLLYCFLSFAGFAQKNLREAVVVFRSSTDTVKGFIEYREWFTNPTVILFARDKNTAVTRYTAEEVNYFEIAGRESYQRHTVSVSLSNDAISSSGGEDTTTETRTVFLKMVVPGNPLRLLSYRDDIKQRLYVLEAGIAAPAELLNRVYMFNGQVKEEKLYRTDLTAWANKYRPGDNRLISQISGLGYYAGDIAGICRKIDGISVQTIQPAAAIRQGTGIRIFVGAGISRTRAVIDGNERFADRNANPFYSPVAVIGADIPFNPAVGKLVFRAQLNMTAYKTDGYIFLDYNQYTEEYFLTFKQQNIQVTPQLLYNIYNREKLKWFVAAGITINFSSYPTNKMYFIRKSSTNAQATDNSYLKYLRNAWLNFCLATGVSVNRFELSMRYCPPASITQSTGYGIDNASLQLHLNFYIKK